MIVVKIPFGGHMLTAYHKNELSSVIDTVFLWTRDNEEKIIIIDIDNVVKMYHTYGTLDVTNFIRWLAVSFNEIVDYKKSTVKIGYSVVNIDGKQYFPNQRSYYRLIYVISKSNYKINISPNEIIYNQVLK